MKKESWLKTLFTFAAPYKTNMILSVICAIISVVGGFIPFLGIYQIISLFINGTVTTKALLFWCGICAVSYIIYIIFYGISTVLSHTCAYAILEGLRLRIADRLMRAPLGEVTSKTIGYLKNIIVDKVEGIERPLAHMIPEMGSNILLAIAVFIYLFTIDWRMGLASMVTIPFAVIPMALSVKTFNLQYAAYMEANDYVNSVIVEYVQGIEVVKTFNQTTKSYEKFQNAVKSFKDFTLSWFQSTWKAMNFIFAILPTTLLGTLPIGLILYKNGSLTPSELTMCLILSIGIIGPILKSTSFINELKAMEHSVNGSKELLNLKELKSEENYVDLNHYNVEFKDVSFSYNDNDYQMVLNELNFKIPEKNFTALVGPSGSGKSTVAKLIARFWDVSGGSITIGGIDIRKIPLSQLASMVSFVTQDNFLFNCSIKENIRLGNLKASDEEVLKAAKAACCDEFIRNLEKGYDTLAGEAGKGLSGGEKQRIAIARSILKDAPIVILDEATAFTDPENEEKIQRSIMALAKGKTLLVIAHRLSTIQNADQILVLKNGKIEGLGKQQELLKSCSLYNEMWKSHIGARIWSISGDRKETEKDV
ncbi:ABC transporter ATP-binding protein [Clostridium sporogenes]|uniref:ABC transporter ATP-binding protein n=1 Tax=unclassified Clostridium TaxID=2614128 RepID=UPI0013D2272C|nr:ABC transporter ATP-binding protein [Clostridium sporogenes]NFS24669.1 ABC transporter ATP-binding protein [Clostridium sporogenes]